MYFGVVDDVFGGSRRSEETKRLSDIVKKELFHSGFIHNDNKSPWEPRQEGELLGFYVNFKDGTLSLPPPPPKNKKGKKSLGSCLILSWNSFTLQPEWLPG